MYFCTKCPRTVNCVLLIINRRKTIYCCSACRKLYLREDILALDRLYREITTAAEGHKLKGANP